MKIRHLLLFVVLLVIILSACAPDVAETPSPTHDNLIRPSDPVYEQLVWDCNTGDRIPDSISDDYLIQPGSGCDSWQINRYERPFNAVAQNEYFPDLDILSAELGLCSSDEIHSRCSSC